MTLPALSMLADFSIRLASGMAFALLLTRWRMVPAAFYRTHCLIMLGLLVVAALFTPDVTTRTAMGSAAALAYIGSIGWGLGARRIGVPAVLLLLVLSAGTLVAASLSGPRPMMFAATGLASAALLGFALSAMLLGHHYLTAPAMSIEPLERFVKGLGASLAVRFVLASIVLWSWWPGRDQSASVGSGLASYLAMRWGIGFAATGVAAWLGWRTVAIRSTQSATGILYIAMTFVLFGELTALILSRQTGAPF